jgi:hypothetical protein
VRKTDRFTPFDRYGAMSPRTVNAVVTARLRSIRDVAHDLDLEISRAPLDRGSGIRAMVEHIRRETDAALRLLEKSRPSTRR